MSKQPVKDPATCPACKEPDVKVGHTRADGLRFRRCPACRWSWFTRIKTPS